jgi:hypothetical protein
MGDKYLDQILLPRSRIRDSANGAPQQRTADESLQFRVPEIGVSLLWIWTTCRVRKDPAYTPRTICQVRW